MEANKISAKLYC